jgi:hypothetical protein
MIDENGTKLTARNLRLDDYQALRKIALKAYKGVAEPASTGPTSMATRACAPGV